jgi:hypothetical protein
VSGNHICEKSDENFFILAIGLVKYFGNYKLSVKGYSNIIMQVRNKPECPTDSLGISLSDKLTELPSGIKWYLAP